MHITMNCPNKLLDQYEVHLTVTGGRHHSVRQLQLRNVLIAKGVPAAENICLWLQACALQKQIFLEM